MIRMMPVRWKSAIVLSETSRALVVIGSRATRDGTKARASSSNVDKPGVMREIVRRVVRTVKHGRDRHHDQRKYGEVEGTGHPNPAMRQSRRSIDHWPGLFTTAPWRYGLSQTCRRPRAFAATFRTGPKATLSGSFPKSSDRPDDRIPPGARRPTRIPASRYHNPIYTGRPGGGRDSLAAGAGPSGISPWHG